MSASIVASYNDAVSVSFTSEAWFNATTVAAHFGRRPVDWLALDSTKDYIAHLGAVLNCEESSLLRTKAGRHGGGTWLHPKLAVAFARWLDVRFAIWCDMQIDKILHDRPTIALKDLRSKKALPGGLTLDQQDAIKEMVRTRAEEAPEARRGIVAVKLWSALKAKFGCPYKLIPPEHFTDALSLLARLEIEGETPPALAAPVVSPIAHHPGSAARGRERIDTLRLWANRALPEHVRDPFLTALADIERSLTMGWTEVDEATMHIWTGLALLKRWNSHP